MSDEQIEQEIQAKGLTAPRISPTDIEAEIVSEYYFTAENGVMGRDLAEGGDGLADYPSPAPLEVLTFCVLLLKNGYTVTGESACVSLANFDAEIGRKVARQNAIDKMWPLMGYALRSKLAA